MATLIALAVAPCLFAQTSSPTPAASSPARDYSKEAWVVQQLSNSVVFQSDGSGRREQALVVRLQSAEGVRQFGVLTIPYDAGHENIEQIDVRVRKPDGKVVVTPQSSAQDMPTEASRSAPMYSDLREKQLPVKSLSAGDVLEYKVVWVRTKTEIPDQFWYSQSFTKNGVVLEETLRIDVPSGKYVKVRSPDDAPDVTENGGRRVYVWKHSQLEPSRPKETPKPKKQMPEPVLPSVQLSTFHSWEELGNWFGALMAKQAEVTPAIQAKASELTQGLTSDLDKEHALYEYVATKFRYISISFGAGRYQPHAAEEVLNNQYGDCKDKHTLLVALLKSAGFTAWPALMNSAAKIDPELPSPAQFDHVITVLPVGKEYVWLDTTPEIAPWAALIPPLRDKQALVIPGNAPARLETTPMDLPFPSVQRVFVKGDLSGEGTFTGHFDEVFRGDAEMIFRSVFHQTEPAKWQDFVQSVSYLSGLGGVVTNVDVDNLEETEKPFHVSWDYERKNYSDWDDHRITPPFPSFGLPFGEGDSKPDEPIAMGSPGEIVYRAEIHLPKNYSAELPEDAHFENAYGAYSAVFDLKDGVLTAERKLVIRRSRIPVSAWDNYLALEKSIDADTQRWIQLSSTGGNATDAVVRTHSDPHAAELVQQGWTALQNHDFTSSADAFEKAKSLNAKEPGLEASMGYLSMMRNEREKGFEHYRREIANNPGNQPAYHLLVDELMRDRRRDDALATLRSLLGVAPGDIKAVQQYAGILIAEKRYQEALPPVETALKSSPGNLSLQFLQMRVLLRLGRKEEGVALARSIGENSPEKMALNDVAYFLADDEAELPLAREYVGKAISGLEDDLKDVHLATLANDDLKHVASLAAAWDTLGWVYFRTGELDKAERCLNAAWMLGQGGVMADHLGQVYERQGKRDAAVHAYQLAIAASPGMEDTRERLKNLGGPLEPQKKILTQKPGEKPFRVPPLSRSPGEELGNLRTTGIPELGRREGTAEFFLLFSAHKVEDAQFISGSDQLKTAASALLKAQYNVPFADDGPEKLVRRGILSCSPYTKPSCQFVFLQAGSATK